MTRNPDLVSPLIAHMNSHGHQQNEYEELNITQQTNHTSASAQHLSSDYLSDAGEEAVFDEDTHSPYEDNEVMDTSILAQPRQRKPFPTKTDVLDSVDQSEVSTLNILHTIKNSQLKNYFMNEELEKQRSSRVNITGAFVKRAQGVPPSNTELATDEAVRVLTVYTRLYNSMSVKDRGDFVWLCNELLAIHGTKDAAERFGPVHIPRDITEAHRICKKGKGSISEALPIPQLQIVPNDGKNDHACAEPMDLLHYVFGTLPTNALDHMSVASASMTIPESPEKVTTYMESPAFIKELRRIRKELNDPNFTNNGEFDTCFVVPYKFWSDGFSLNAIKDNRNSVHAIVWTFLIGGSEVVVPVSIGPKQADHHFALRWIMNRIGELGVFITVRHLSTKKNIRIRLVLALCNVDRPECGELWGAMMHSADRCKCSGVISGYPNNKNCSIQEKIVACKNCYQTIISTALNPKAPQVLPTSCKECTCFDHASQKECIKGPVPPDIIALGKKIKSFNGDLDDWTESTKEYQWLVGNPADPPAERPLKDVESYGAVDVRKNKEFLLIALQFLTYQTWAGGITSQEQCYAWARVCGLSRGLSLNLFQHALRHRKEKTKSFVDVFTADLVPPLWLDADVSLSKFLSAPMHLLFLGMQQTTFDMLEEWMSFRNFKDPFVRHASKFSDMIGKLGLQYMMALKYGVTSLTRGSWVSENYVAISKCQLLMHIGLLLNQKLPDAEVKIVLRVVDSCFCCIAVLMQRSRTEQLVQRGEVIIRLYLSAIDELDRLLHACRQEKKRKEASKEDGNGKRQRSINGEIDNPLSENAEAGSTPSSSSQTAIDPQSENAEKGSTSSSPSQTATDLAATQSQKQAPPRRKCLAADLPNFCSLPTISQHMREYGPAVDTWEGSEGCEKSIQGLKPWFKGICMVDGGAVLAAKKRYWRDRMLLEQYERNANKRQRYTNAKRYKNREEVESLIEAGDEITGSLYQLAESDDQVVLVAIGGGDDPALFELSLSDDIVSFENDCPRSFGGDLVFFVKLSMKAAPRHILCADDKLLTHLILVSGKHIWRPERKVRGEIIKEVLSVDSLYTVVSDDYYVLREDGKIKIKDPSPSIWTDIASNRRE